MTASAISSRAKILVVDHDQQTRLATALALAEAGFDVDHADSGLALLDHLEPAPPALILLDGSLPDQSAYEVCEELRRRAAGEHVPVLMMTDGDDPQAIERAFAAGATDFIARPINGPMLGHRVRYLLRAAATSDALRSSQRRLANAQNITQIGDWEWDLEHGRLDASEQLCEIFGGDSSVWDNSFDSVIGCVYEEDRLTLEQALESAIAGGAPFALDHRIVLPNGDVRTVHHQGKAATFDSDGRVLRLAGIVQDITDRKQTENRIRQLAYFDTLTGLPNRLHFSDLLRNALVNAQRREIQVGIMFIDMDNFKRINDTLGHAQGDEFLKAVAKRLAECVRVTDSIPRKDPEFVPDSVSRLGGDEFTILLPGLKQTLHCSVVARRILEGFKQPIMIAGQEIFASASIGIAMYPNDGAEVDALLMNADAAMYRAKDMGRNNFQFYDGLMNADARQRLKLESDLRRALERDELFLEYQPKVNIKSGYICGAEALLRWQHPERGLVPPLEFIAIAEETGLITALGARVLSAACDQFMRWRAELGATAPGSVSVNLSRAQLCQGDLVEMVQHELLRSGMQPQWLRLEVTESLAMQDSGALGVLHRLKGLGVSLALDDFGTGYSSLACLHEIPVDVVKIDRSFVSQLAQRNHRRVLIQATVLVARALGIQTVAEGVDTPEQARLLDELGCSMAQGFLFGRPMSPEVFARWECPRLEAAAA